MTKKKQAPTTSIQNCHFTVEAAESSEVAIKRAEAVRAIADALARAADALKGPENNATCLRIEQK